MWMTVGDDEGERVVELPQPGVTVRFAVGSPEAHGLPWRVWSSPSTRDVYLMVRASHTASKWSFHASGDWRLQHLPNYVEAHGLERIVDRWVRPDPDDNGLVHAITIRTPTDQLATSRHYPVKGNDVKWISPAPAGHFIGVHLMILTATDRRVEFANGYILAVIPLVDETVAMLVVSSHPFEEPVLTAYEEARRRAASITPPEVAAEPDARITLHGVDDDGKRFVWDTRF